MSENNAPAISTEQELPVRLAVVAHDGAQIGWEAPISWVSSDEDVFTVLPNPQDGREAVVQSIGVGVATLTVETSINVAGQSHKVSIEGVVTVTGKPGEYTVSLEWGDPRPKTEANPVPSGTQT